MKQKLFTLFIFSLTISGCYTTKTQPSTTKMQGISGFVYETTGNHMPLKDAPKKTPKGFQCTILVYEPTNIAQVDPQTTTTLYTKILTKQVALVNTDSTGFFKIELPIGKYSLFIQQGDRYFANMFDQFNNIALFEVLPSIFTDVKLTVNKAAAY